MFGVTIGAHEAVCVARGEGHVAPPRVIGAGDQGDVDLVRGDAVDTETGTALARWGGVGEGVGLVVVVAGGGDEVAGFEELGRVGVGGGGESKGEEGGKGAGHRANLSRPGADRDLAGVGCEGRDPGVRRGEVEV